ncbi:hypothetical protein ACLOAV_003680 [Pseudogymnoascus australis]
MSSAYYSPIVSDDLIWEVARSQNAYIVKRKGVQFSRDPLNLVNLHSRKHGGFVNTKAVGIAPAEGDKGGVTLVTKKAGNAQRPAAATQVTINGSKSNRKTYKSVANTVAKGYRGDLRAAAVSRASAIRKSQRAVKERPASAPRGVKAKKAAAAAEEN